MGNVTAVQIPEAVAGETNLFGVSMVKALTPPVKPEEAGELITGTPTVTEVTSSDLTITNVAFNTAAAWIDGKVVPTGKGILFKVLGQGTTNSPYTLKITFATDSSPAETKIRFVTFTVLL